MKTLEQMTELEKRTLASWIRRKMQGRVDTTILVERTDQELLLQYFRTSKISRTGKGQWQLWKMTRATRHESVRTCPPTDAVIRSQIGIHRRALPLSEPRRRKNGRQPTRS